MLKNKKIIYPFSIIPLIIILSLFGWFLIAIFEGEKPLIVLEPHPEFLSKGQKFTYSISDKRMGLKKLKVSVNQEGKEINLFEQEFPYKGLLNRKGVHRYEKELFIDPLLLDLAQGRADINIHVWDYSRKSGGDGNHTLTQHKMTVDTIPPAIRAISRMHNINMGGAGLVIYQASSDTEESGLFVDDIFSPGFPADGKTLKGVHVSYFTVPFNSGLKPSIYLWAKDRADNHSNATFYYHIRRKQFRNERIEITDRFLKRILPYFSFYPLNPAESDINKFIKINNELRKENNHTLLKLGEKTSPKRLWQGPWLRLKNSATMARFADHRSYYYKGKKFDEQVHLGIDLASLENSPVQATNHGRIIFAERLGIYGLTVVLDHGQGLASLYSHLSKIEVTPDQEVKKGDIIGLTGQTGLAGGDHLHFAIMVNGIFVSPIEWFDGHWIKDNITKKLALVSGVTP